MNGCVVLIQVFSTPPLSECRIDIDREMDTSVFRGFDTEMDDSTVAQAFAIGKDAVNSLAWQKLGAKLLRAVINASLINDF